MKCCDFNRSNDSTEYGKGQPCEAGWQKLNSQLSILVDKSNAENSFISPSDEEDTNKKWMWSSMRQMKRLECRFAVYSIACLMLKKKRLAQLNSPLE